MHPLTEYKKGGNKDGDECFPGGRDRKTGPKQPVRDIRFFGFLRRRRDPDILVKVEGCGICGTDAHEFKRDPFGLIPVAIGHEGTGEIVKMGKNVTKDSAGKPVLGPLRETVTLPSLALMEVTPERRLW